MTEEKAAAVNTSAPEQPKTDTQRLRAVEATVQSVGDTVRSLVPRVEKLEKKTTETRQTLEILKAMVTTVLTGQEEIRDQLGIVGATRDAVVVLMEKHDVLSSKLDGLMAKVDRLPCRDEGGADA